MIPNSRSDDPTPGPWKPARPLPMGVAGFARGVVGGNLLVAGGTAWEGDTKQLPETIWLYGPRADRWTETGRLTRPFAFGISATVGSELILLGGDDGQQTRADGHALRPDGTNAPTASLPRPAAYAGFTSTPEHIYIIGGTSSLHDLAKTHASFYRFSLTSGRTEHLPDFPGGPVIHAALATADGNIYAFPGGLRDPSVGTIQNSKAAWRYVISRSDWESIAPYPVGIRGLAAKALDDRFILLAGGLKSIPLGQTEITGDCHLYDIRTDTYIPLPSLPHASMLLGLEIIDGYIYAFGGEDRPKHRSAHVFRARVADLVALGESSTR